MVFVAVGERGESHREPCRDSSCRGRLEPGELRIAAGPAKPLRRDIGVQGHRPRQPDDVGRPGRHGFGGLTSSLETTRDHQRCVRDSPCPAGELEEVRPRRSSIRTGWSAGEVGPTADVDQIHSLVSQKRHGNEGVVLVQSALQLIARVDLHSDRELRTHLRTNLPHDGEEKPASRHDRPAVVIGTTVEQRRQELTQQETVAGVYLDTIETDGSGMSGRPGVDGRQRVNIG